MNQDLINWRKQIDKIDEEIFNLIIKRVKVARMIAKCKKEQEFKIVDRGREAKIITKVGRLAKNKEINPESAKRVFKNIIKLTKKEMRNELPHCRAVR